MKTFIKTVATIFSTVFFSLLIGSVWVELDVEGIIFFGGAFFSFYVLSLGAIWDDTEPVRIRTKEEKYHLP